METDKLRSMFANFLKENGIAEGLSCNHCITETLDKTLKYERIDKYSVLFLTYKELMKLLKFCSKHGISVWFGADKLCIGFNYTGSMRLSAYDSVPPGTGCSELATDIITCDPPEPNDLITMGIYPKFMGGRNKMNICPRCKNDNVVEETFPNSKSARLEYRLKCGDCGYEWIEGVYVRVPDAAVINRQDRTEPDHHLDVHGGPDYGQTI
jgi:hypothetical protein